MKYKNMLEEDLVGKEITILCRGFRNPTYPHIMPGFKLEIYDGEETARMISGTRAYDTNNVFDITKDLHIDATAYTPAQIPQGFFSVNPSSN
jgi:hypothetical protein